MGAEKLVGVACSPGVAVGRLTRSVGDGGDTPHVVVAAELTPADVTSLGGSVQAVATMAGGPLSHATILLRSRGLPAVSGLGADLLAIPDGTPALVDGDAGTVCVGPTADEVERAGDRQRVARRAQQEAHRLAGSPAMSRDGRVVPVLANVGSLQDAQEAIGEGADGVGMLRTEFVFLNREQPPGEREQYNTYRAIAEAIGDRPLVIRTLDLGADVPAWDAPPEPNPALGNRGIRLALAQPDLLQTQLRAVARLGADRPVAVMFPMVTTVDELNRARAYLDEARGSSPSRLDVGITVEVPAAALTAHAFARRVDFFAVGTNDLTQYTLAADRANAAVAALADGLHPAVLRLLGEVTKAAEHEGRTVCVVGELGTDPMAVAVLLGLGVTSLSVRPNAVADVKQLVRSVTVAEARALAAAALDAESAPAVRALVTRNAPRG